jgi:hypothetical protein
MVAPQSIPPSRAVPIASQGELACWLAALTPSTQPVLAGPVTGELSMAPLLHFRSLMAGEGQSVQLARMCYDRLYAHERIAVAHASAHDPLRRLALELFQAYHWRAQMRTFDRPS